MIPSTTAQQLHCQSVTGGLWGRFIAQLIGSWMVTFFGVNILLVFVGAFFPLLDRGWLKVVYLVVIVLDTLYMWRRIPLDWDNVVSIDFTAERLTITNQKAANTQYDVLDFAGRSFSFAEIDAYTPIHYDSPLFSTYYLVELHVQDEVIKCLSFRNANEFTRFVTVLTEQVGVSIR